MESDHNATPESMQESSSMPKTKVDEVNLDGVQVSSSNSGTPLCNGDNAFNMAPKVETAPDLHKQTIIVDNQIICASMPIEGSNTEKVSPVGAEEVSSVLTESHTGKERKFLRSEAERPQELWVQCDKCRKWRHVPTELDGSIKAMTKWTCRDNVDKRFADCSIPQEKSDDEINQAIGYSEISNGENDIVNGQVDLVLRHAELNDVTVQTKNCWTLIKQSIYTHRKRKQLSHDEVMVCACEPPKDGSPGCGDGCLNRELCIECVPDACPCGEQCSNQRFQKRLYAKVEYFRCGKKGFGLRVLENIPIGSFIIEYVGEVLDLQEHEARQKEYAQKGQKHFYFMALSRDEVIDACKKGNFGRYINHSCNPNCQTEKWTVNGEVCIGFFAKRDLVKGEEVTFDYNYVRVLGAAAKKCECGTPECKGFIGGDSDIPSVVVENESDIEEPDPIVIIDGSDDRDATDSIKPSETPKVRSIKITKAHASDTERNISLKKVNVKKLRRPKPVSVSNSCNTFSAKGLTCNTSGRPEGVEEKLNEMLDANGGLAKRREIAKHYLQLLVVTFTSGDASGEASGSTRDLSMVLDALLKTESRTLLTRILAMNGLQLLDILIKKHSKDFNKTPIIRKLLKILHNLALKRVITQELLNSMPKGSGVTSFEESISNLTRHSDQEVQRLARHIQTNWRLLPVGKTLDGKHMHNGTWNVKHNNQNWRRFPQNACGFPNNKYKAPSKNLELSSQVIGDDKTLKGETVDNIHNRESMEKKVIEGSNEWKFPGDQSIPRSGKQCAESCPMGPFVGDHVQEHRIENIGILEQMTDHTPNQELHQNHFLENEQSADHVKIEGQKSHGQPSLSACPDDKHFSQSSKNNAFAKNLTGRWPNRYAYNGSHWKDKSIPSISSSALADPKPPDKSMERQHMVPTIPNMQHQMTMPPLPSVIGGTPAMPPGNQIGEIPMQNGLTPQMPVAFGIPIEIFQQLHGLPIRRMENLAPRAPRSEGGRGAPAIPCRLPCEHFSMQPMTNNFRASGGPPALPHPLSSRDVFRHPPPRAPPLPRAPRPSNLCSGHRQLQNNQRAFQNSINGIALQSDKILSEVRQIPEPEPPVPGLSPPHVLEGSTRIKYNSPVFSETGDIKRSIMDKRGMQTISLSTGSSVDKKIGDKSEDAGNQHNENNLLGSDGKGSLKNAVACTANGSDSQNKNSSVGRISVTPKNISLAESSGLCYTDCCDGRIGQNEVPELNLKVEACKFDIAGKSSFQDRQCKEAG
eukprot:TRINITY_DN3823_c0_g1_i1.p1 TRINITY_DN3823_c0_g1~~TRINITY_DN3823_c0_g1_i1.p1  ORF type:complete len:1400 (-),score=307.70 TRINITY_DN3823_c0_g1_i1:652-4425(-)